MLDDDDLPVLDAVVRGGDAAVIRGTRLEREPLATSAHIDTGPPIASRRAKERRRDARVPARRELRTRASGTERTTERRVATRDRPAGEADLAEGIRVDGTVDIDATRDVVGGRVSRFLAELFDLGPGPDADACAASEALESERLDDTLELAPARRRLRLATATGRAEGRSGRADEARLERFDQPARPGRSDRPRRRRDGSIERDGEATPERLDALVDALVERHAAALRDELRELLGEALRAHRR